MTDDHTRETHDIPSVPIHQECRGPQSKKRWMLTLAWCIATLAVCSSGAASAGGPHGKPYPGNKSGTTLSRTIGPRSFHNTSDQYQRLGYLPGWPIVVREDMAAAGPKRHRRNAPHQL